MLYISNPDAHGKCFIYLQKEKEQPVILVRNVSEKNAKKKAEDILIENHQDHRDEVANEGLPVPQELLRTIEYLAKEGPKKFLSNSTFFHVVNDKDIEKYPLLMDVLGIVDSLIYDPVDEEVYVDYCGCPWWYSACEDDEVAWSIFKKVQEVFKEAFIARVTKL